MIPELHRPVQVARVGPFGLEFAVKATDAECAALAPRMKLPAIAALHCDFRLEWDSAGSLLAHGHLVARVVQVCVVSLEEFTDTVEDQFVVRCVEQGRESEQADPETPDEIVYADGILDLGEAAAQQLALALDPYPHAPGAEMPDIAEEPAAHPFATLAGLRQRH
jgi:Large ribosomal RNA subunit accumulation protein YceD